MADVALFTLLTDAGWLQNGTKLSPRLRRVLEMGFKINSGKCGAHRLGDNRLRQLCDVYTAIVVV